MSVLSSMDLPTTEVDLGPEKIEDKKEGGPLFHCDFFDTEVVHKLAQMFLPGLATACVDHTTGDPFRTPGLVAVDLRKEMMDNLTQRSETFVAESIILEGGPDGEVLYHPFDIISDFVDDFARSKRNLFSRISGWLLSEKREDKIDDFVQEMEINGFWLLDRRQRIAETLLKNVDFKNLFHCGMKFNSAEDLANHVHYCSFRSMICENEGCNTRFCASQSEKHDSVCPFKIIPCEQKCSESIMRREMDRHCITVCPMKLVNCPFFAVGCRSAVAQCMIEKHCSEDLHSHMLYTLQGIYKEVSKEDLKRRVEQIMQASSNSKLAEARHVRSLTFAVKKVEATLGPLEVSPKPKYNAENNAKNEDVEDSDIKGKGGQHGVQNSNMEDCYIKEKSSEQSTQISSIINSSDKTEVRTIMNKDSIENNVKNEGIECSHIENKGGEESTEISNMANASDEAGVSSVDSVDIYRKNKDEDSNWKIKGNSRPINTEISSHKPEVNPTNKDSEEDNLKIKDIEDNNFEDRDNDESIQTSRMENKSSEEYHVKNKDIEDFSLEAKGSKESIQTSNVENLSDDAMKKYSAESNGSEESRHTSSTENSSDKVEE